MRRVLLSSINWAFISANIVFLMFIQTFSFANTPQANQEKQIPKIEFEKTVHDFNNLVIREKSNCEFKFKNTGSGRLVMGKIKSTCGCTIPELNKKTYESGEEGTIKVQFASPHRPGKIEKHIFVQTNVHGKKMIELAVKANIVKIVDVVPSKLEFLESWADSNMPEIVLTSLDGEAFSIKKFVSSNRVITADFDSSVKDTKIVIKPQVDMKLLKGNPKGMISIDLSHPHCKDVVLFYEQIEPYQAQPNRLYIVSAEPNKPLRRGVVIKNLEGKPFEIDSVSSKDNWVKMISQVQDGNSVKLDLQITPPAKTAGSKRFHDAIKVSIKDDSSIDIGCDAYYKTGKPGQPQSIIISNPNLH